MQRNDRTWSKSSAEPWWVLWAFSKGMSFKNASQILSGKQTWPLGRHETTPKTEFAWHRKNLRGTMERKYRKSEGLEKKESKNHPLYARQYKWGPSGLGRTSDWLAEWKTKAALIALFWTANKGLYDIQSQNIPKWLLHWCYMSIGRKSKVCFSL